jgi:Domain of unknown function (DUF1707)
MTQPAEQRGALPGAQPQIRASDRDRDAVAHRLQDAFAEGRLDDEEFDQRMRAALSARTGADLDVLTTDLPATATAQPAVSHAEADSKPSGRAIAYKGPLRRAGRWRVPERFTSIVYKGSGVLDLRVADLSGPVTTLRVISYKSRTDILVPPGVRVELDGIGVSKAWSADEPLETSLAADAPVVRVRGIGYKGVIEVSTKPHGPAAPGQQALPA